ncbi:hypothetical protein XBKB1_1880004 [Xenorhabdus bovienii str. kraussei Becker Underwood]|uniref:Uncharacterized protein n=1 Tax=Xenorhabdus bovienii str. kraussei Becker Underwood TaxID=1398204 RepID=A0A077PRD2_XENBV|nr:hypothetical protein XBKB1_1880004 [Xenorhabdus bovienii str. kraussei Becker Underwood]
MPAWKQILPAPVLSACSGCLPYWELESYSPPCHSQQLQSRLMGRINVPLHLPDGKNGEDMRRTQQRLTIWINGTQVGFWERSNAKTLNF